MPEFAERKSRAFIPEVKNGYDHGAIVPAAFFAEKTTWSISPSFYP